MSFDLYTQFLDDLFTVLRYHQAEAVFACRERTWKKAFSFLVEHLSAQGSKRHQMGRKDLSGKGCPRGDGCLLYTSDAADE